MKSNVTFLVILLFLVSCGQNGSSPLLGSNILPLTKEIGAGQDSVSCFLNKLASQEGQTIYTTSEMTLSSDGTGTNHFELFDNPECTNTIASGTTTILNYETVSAGSMQIFKMLQDDGSNQMDIWIPVKFVEGDLYMNIDFSLGESGPYLYEPSEAEFADFESDPTHLGLLVQIQ